MMRIGYIHRGYPEKRNILEAWNRNDVTLHRIIDVFKVINSLVFKVFGIHKNWLHNICFFPFKVGNVGSLHFFNGIWLFANKPWICTFESVVPRVGIPWLEKLLVKQLAKENCKALIAISKCNFQMQIRYLRENHTDLADRIIPKIKQRYPPQAVMKEAKVSNSATLKILFVGRDFYQKGGEVLLRCFNKLNVKYAPYWELTIVSKMDVGFISNYSLTRKEQVDQILKESKNITHYHELPYEKVNEIMQDSDVIALPTFGDTFGYSVLEGMANGCAVVATNLRALPELVSDKNGYVIALQKNESSNIDRTVDMETHDAVLSKGLIHSLEKLMNDWHNDKLSDKKKNSINWVKNNCDVLENGAFLKGLIEAND